MRLFQNVIDRARIPLNDSDKTRYPDAQLLSYATDAILTVRKLRPDLFLGSWTLPATEYLVTDAVPIDDVYFPALCDYVTGRAEFRDDEAAMQQRAVTLAQLFTGAL